MGVITEVTLRVAPLPTAKRHAAWVFPSFVAGTNALHGLAHELGRAALPTICRLSDEDETRVNLTLAGGSGRHLLRYLRARGLDRPTLLVLVWEGTDERELRHRDRAARRLLGQAGGRRLPKQVGRAWERGRFSGPYLRDELMDHRFLVETLETATSWANLSRLHAAVGAAIRGALEVEERRAVVMCHVSHVYPDGASLYYTFVTPESERPARPVASRSRPRRARRSSIPAGPSPTITPSALTTALTSLSRSARSGWVYFVRSRPNSTHRGSSTPAS